MKSWIITGGAACGKSQAIECLRALLGVNVAWFSADEAVRLAFHDPAVAESLQAMFGDEICSAKPTTSGELVDRNWIRQNVMPDAGRRLQLESVIHPHVLKALANRQTKARSSQINLLVAEVPLHYEIGATVLADLVIVVASSRPVQVRRMMENRGLDEHAVQAFLNAQWPIEAKAERADVVIWNDGDISALQAQVLLLTGHTRQNMNDIPESPTPSESTPAPESPLQAVLPESDLSPKEEAPSQDSPVATASVEEPKQPEGAQPPFPQEVSINDLQNASLVEIQTLAESVGFRLNASRSKHQLIYDLCAWMAEHRTRLKVEGLLEIGADNFGLIRYPKYSFTPLPEDVFVPLFLVRKFNLRASQRIAGIAKAPKDKDKYIAIDRITEVEGIPIEQWESPVEFDKLTATFPTKRLILETPKPCPVSVRILDLVAPLGKGQRGLICAPPRSGKTILLKDVAKSIVANHKEVVLIVVLLDERPEEVTDFEETVQGCEIYSSTFDESPKRHSQVAEIVRERACRLVEMKKDVVILLDSVTRLARGYNSLKGGKGASMTGGLDKNAMIKPKKFFGAARNVEEGGSLTIIATALIETESKMDEVIFEEFKGTGNMEATLDREISERRIFPALHVLKSGTRRDDLLYHPEEFKRIAQVRKQLAQVPAVEALELLIRNINRTSNNAEILLGGLK